MGTSAATLCSNKADIVAEMYITSWTSLFLLFIDKEWTNMAASLGTQVGSKKYFCCIDIDRTTMLSLQVEMFAHCLHFTLILQSPLTLFVHSNSEWIASPGPSNNGAKRSKVEVGHEKPGKKSSHFDGLHCSDAVTLRHNFTLLLPYLFRIKHTSIVRVINFMLAVMIHEKSPYQMLQ